MKTAVMVATTSMTDDTMTMARLMTPTAATSVTVAVIITSFHVRMATFALIRELRNSSPRPILIGLPLTLTPLSRSAVLPRGVRASHRRIVVVGAEGGGRQGARGRGVQARSPSPRSCGEGDRGQS